MKFISWNVNGIRACCDKGFRDAFKSLDADFFCLQETKMQEGQLDLSFDGYQSFWNYAQKKGYSGTAIFTRHQPLQVTYGLGVEEHDQEGRVITLEMENFYLITVYTPNSQDGLKRLDYRMTWEDEFRAYLKRLDAHKPVIVCGDLNVAHREIDLKNPKTNRMNAGFTDQDPLAFFETGNNKCGIRRRLHITARQNGKNDHHNGDHGNHGCMFEYKFHLVSSLFSADAFRSAFCFCVCVIFTIAFFAG